jgi:hypothetical protein
MQNIDKSLIVVYGLEYDLPMPAAVHDVIPSVWILYAKRPRHKNGYQNIQNIADESRADPYIQRNPNRSIYQAP